MTPLSHVEAVGSCRAAERQQQIFLSSELISSGLSWPRVGSDVFCVGETLITEEEQTVKQSAQPGLPEPLVVTLNRRWFYSNPHGVQVPEPLTA